MKTKNLFKDETVVGSPMKHYLTLAVILFLFWILLSGKMDLKFLTYGLATSLISAWICGPLLLLENASGTKKYFAFDVSLGKYALYWLWLLKEVVKANWDVVKATIRPEMEINPRVIRFEAKLDNPMAHATLANSITLTPGTVTINLTDDGLYEIHALTDGAAEGLLSGDMQRKVADLFGENMIYRVIEEGEQ